MAMKLSAGRCEEPPCRADRGGEDITICRRGKPVVHWPALPSRLLSYQSSGLKGKGGDPKPRWKPMTQTEVDSLS